MNCRMERSSLLARNGEHSQSLFTKMMISFLMHRVRIPEALFRPSLAGLPVEGIHEIVSVSSSSIHLPLNPTNH